MKTYTKLLTGCATLGLFLFSAQKGSSQHYANLGTENNATQQKIKKTIISFGFFSPLNHHISIGYDQLLGTDIILTGQLGLIGPGLTTETTPSTGAFLEIGTKLFFSPTWVMDGMRRMNAMQGGYFKPQFVVSAFSQNLYYSPYSGGPATTPRGYTGLALILNLGHQWIFSNSFSLDMYLGIGYNLSSLGSGNLNYPYNSFSEPQGGNYYSYISDGLDMPLVFTGGVNLGVPF